MDENNKIYDENAESAVNNPEQEEAQEQEKGNDGAFGQGMPETQPEEDGPATESCEADVIDEAEETVDTKTLKKIHNKEIQDAWKAEKKAARALKKERKKSRPFWKKILSVSWKVIAAIIAVLVLFVGLGGKTLISEGVNSYYNDNVYAIETMETEEIRDGVEIDEEKAQKIDAMTGYSKDDTWAVYIYMVGSNLESYGEDDLSSMVKTLTSQEAAANNAAENATYLEYINDYNETISDAGLELPSPMYNINKPVASSKVVTEDVTVADESGASENDMAEMRKAELSENVEIVIQTGGAKRWTNPMINPNRVQRWCIDKDGMREEDNIPVCNMASADTLADFMSYCETNHDADHKIIIFWNHGAASFGYGQDELYGNIMSLKDMQNAFIQVYGENPSEIPYEIIGFDACLMACAEAANEFDGYGRYLVASEETEPGQGWYYTRWLTALSQDPSMNGAQIGKLIADEYMDFYTAFGKKLSVLNFKWSLCFSVLDIHQAKTVYDDYTALVKKVLADTVSNPSALTKLSRAADNSIHFCGSYYDIYNTVDLGNLAEDIADTYPQESASILNHLDKAVLYNRSMNALTGVTGLSIYYPGSTTQTGGLLHMMKYLDTVTDNQDLNALYFYKSAGCLKEEMQSYMSGAGMGTLNTINTAALEAVSSSPVNTTSEGNFTLTVSDDARNQIQNCYFALGMYDKDSGRAIDYGQDNMVRLDSDSNLVTNFNGEWISLNGVPLATEIVQSRDDYTSYRTNILLDGKEAYLLFNYSVSDDAFNITGAYYKEEDTLGYIPRNTTNLTKGMRITPVYEYTDSDYGAGSFEGESIKFDSNTEIKYDKLDNGSYMEALTFTDVRGDVFNSKVLEFDMSGGDAENTTCSAALVYNGN